MAKKRKLMISMRNRNLSFKNDSGPKDPTTTLIKCTIEEGELGSIHIPERVMAHARIICDFSTQTVILNRQDNFRDNDGKTIVVEDMRPLPKLPARYMKEFGEAWKRQSFKDVVDINYLDSNTFGDDYCAT